MRLNRAADWPGSIGWQVAYARGNDAKRVQWRVVKSIGRDAVKISRPPACRFVRPQSAKRFERRALHNTALPAAQRALGPPCAYGKMTTTPDNPFSPVTIVRRICPTPHFRFFATHVDFA